jgi:hypothetical protein
MIMGRKQWTVAGAMLAVAVTAAVGILCARHVRSRNGRPHGAQRRGVYMRLRSDRGQVQDRRSEPSVQPAVGADDRRETGAVQSLSGTSLHLDRLAEESSRLVEAPPCSRYETPG